MGEWSKGGKEEGGGESDGEKVEKVSVSFTTFILLMVTLYR